MWAPGEVDGGEGPETARDDDHTSAEDWTDPAVLARLAADHGPDLLVVCDPRGVIRHAGEAAVRILGLDPEGREPAGALDFVHPDDVESAVWGLVHLSHSPGYHRPVSVLLRSADLGWVRSEVTTQVVDGPGGSWSIFAIRIIEGRDEIAERRDALARLVTSAALECAKASWYDADAVARHLLQAMSGIVGARVAELAWSDVDRPDMPLEQGVHWGADADDGWSPKAGGPGDAFESVCAEQDLWELGVGVVDDLAEHEGDLAGRLRDAGMQSVVELRVSTDHPRALLRLAFDGPPERFELANNDLVVVLAHTVMSTLRRCAAEQRLRERARRDPLTGLLNREAFYRVLERLVASSRHVGTVGVLYGDVDQFKDLNDRFGHGAGDDVLRSVAAALEASVRDGDVVARFGGDEFVAVCRDLDAASDLRAIAERVEERVAEVAVGPARVSVSMGCAVWEQGQSADDLIGAADAAMYRVKRRRRAATG